MTHRARRGITILIALLGLAAGSCSKPKTQDLANSPKPSATPAASVTAPPAASVTETGADACTLLTKEEVQAVQGEPFKDTKPSQKMAAGLSVSQCYFELPTAVNSIVLTVTRKAEGGRDPGQSWQDMFHRERASRRKRKKRGGKGGAKNRRARRGSVLDRDARRWRSLRVERELLHPDQRGRRGRSGAEDREVEGACGKRAETAVTELPAGEAPLFFIACAVTFLS